MYEEFVRIAAAKAAAMEINNSWQPAYERAGLVAICVLGALLTVFVVGLVSALWRD